MAERTVDLSPYAEDGVLDNPLSLELRVPIINTPHPRWNYITAIVVGRWPWPEGPEPTDDEIRIVGSFHEEYCSYWYGAPHTGYRGRTMDNRPFDIDGGAAGRFLTKYANGGWGYRIRTWDRGPTFVPTWQSEPDSLVSVLDRVHHAYDGAPPSDRWVRWKADHAEVFGGGSDVD